MSSQEPEGPRPWWDRALDVLRYEEVAFRFLMRFAAAAGVLLVAILVIRAL